VITNESDYKFELPKGYVPPADEEPVALDLEQIEAEPTSDLDQLRADLPTLNTSDEKIPVPGRDLYAISFRTDIDDKELESYRKRSKSKAHADGVDGIRLGKLLIANTCTGIYRADRQMLDSEGDPLKFAHREFLDLVGATTASDAVKAFYVRDSSINSVGQAILRAAGWGDELDPLDP
jgi:hypothetical protein